MPIPLTVLTVDALHRLLHLRYILAGASVQGLLHQRLLGTTAASERLLQGRIGSQTTVDFDQPVRPSQHRNKGVVELVMRRMLHRFLPNPHKLADRTKHIPLPQCHANGRQTGTRRKMGGRFRGRLVHSDGSPIFGFSSFDRYDPSSFFWQVPFCWRHPAPTLDKI